MYQWESKSTHKILYPQVDYLAMKNAGNRLMRTTEANTTSEVFDGIQSYRPTAPMIYDNAYDANGSLSFAGDYVVSFENNILNLPERMEDPAGHVVKMLYDAQGQKVSYTDSSNSSRDRIYHKGMIYKNGELVYMALPEGYYDGESYYATVSDYLGSVRVVLKNNASAYNRVTEVMEVNHYDPWGVEFGMSEEPFGVQDFKHQGKERMNIFDMNMHDHGARLAFNALGKWTAMDPLMEKYYSTSPYAFCGNNPVRYVDFKGDSLTLNGEDDHVQRILKVWNDALGGNASISSNASGLISLGKAENLTDAQKAIYDALDMIINGTDGMTNLNIVDGSPLVVIGDINKARIDIGDIEALGNGEYVNQVSALMHETYEQYQVQVKNTEHRPAHEFATGLENKIVGYHLDAFNRELKNGVLPVSVYNMFTGKPVSTVQIKVNLFNNVYGTKNNKKR